MGGERGEGKRERERERWKPDKGTNVIELLSSFDFVRSASVLAATKEKTEEETNRKTDERKNCSSSLAAQDG